MSLVNKVDREDILDLARKIFVPEKLNLILVGPYTPAIEARLREIGGQFPGQARSEMAIAR